MQLDELLRLRCADLTAPLSDATQNHYRRSIRQYGDYLGRPATIDDLDAQQLMGWAHACLEQGLAPATANSRVKQPRALWDWAARKRIVDEWPPRSLSVKEPAQIPDAWRATELQALFDCCARQRGYIGPHKAADFWVGLHWWLYNTGERIGATLELTPPMIDLAEGVARVPASVRKGCVRPMVYQFSPKGVEALSRVLSRSDDKVFCLPWRDPQCLYRHYRMLVEDAGLEYKRHKSGPHKIRRTVATLIAGLGGNPSWWLGHASRSTADESYIDRTMLMAHQEGIWPTDKLDPLGRPKLARHARAGWLNWLTG